ncbi:MAG: hypothetical protein U0103_28300 [Candidatus Obscuribacterales bacterium]
MFIAPVLVVLILFFRSCYENRMVGFKNLESDLLPSPEAARLCSFGFDAVIADFYWLLFMQYVGDHSSRAVDKYSKSYDYLNLITGLDANFGEAYYFAAFLIGSEMKKPQLAAELIDKGISANPRAWSIPFVAGINQYLYARNETKAASYYRIAANLPGAPEWLERQSKILEAKIPSMIKEINVWDSMYHNSTSPEIKHRAQNRLVELWLKVYKTAPTKTIKERALNQLRDLGVELDEKSVHLDTEI